MAKIALIPAVTLGLIGGPVALAGPATAATSDRGCTVDPLKPTKHDHKVDFRIFVDCYGDKTVQIRQLRFEDDPGRHDDFLGASLFWKSFDRNDGAVRQIGGSLDVGGVVRSTRFRRDECQST